MQEITEQMMVIRVSASWCGSGSCSCTPYMSIRIAKWVRWVHWQTVWVLLVAFRWQPSEDQCPESKVRLL